MTTTDQFLDRLGRRLHRLDPESLRNYLIELIRERKFLTRLLDRLEEGMIVLNERRQIVWRNKRAGQILDVPDSDERLPFLDRVVSDRVLYQFLAEALDRRSEFVQKEVEILTPRFMRLQITLLFEREGGNDFAIVLFQNLTQNRLEMREQFKLENWETMMGLAAGIAHEIGNPLNSLAIHERLLASLLKESKSKNQKKLSETLEIIKTETDRLDRIVRNFLKAVRRKPLRLVKGELNELVKKTIVLLEPELEAARITVAERYDESLPQFLFDHERLQQALINIIKNAIQAMPKGGKLTVGTERKSGLCFVYFKDSGVGMREEELPKIFDVYYTTKEEGSGLGLMIVHQIIREHGGRIEVLSKKGKGTVFTVILPIRKEKLELPEPEERVNR